jgi:hypothetical protein
LKRSGRGFNRQQFIVLVRMTFFRVGMRTTGTTGFGTRPQGIVHDLTDRTGTTAALGTTAKAAINLARGARQVFSGCHGGPNVVVGQYVARTNDHGTTC